ncbi:MAG: hypothetical protein JNN12_02620 [Bacteroidetes Order II. Incertae sedis bacterium]|nr:hypothetical protein [Bacteroidetes Order II. bacterium]
MTLFRKSVFITIYDSCTEPLLFIIDRAKKLFHQTIVEVKTCKNCGACHVVTPNNTELTTEPIELTAKTYQERNRTRSTDRVLG